MAQVQMQIDKILKFVKLISDDIQTLTEKIDKVTDRVERLDRDMLDHTNKLQWLVTDNETLWEEINSLADNLDEVKNAVKGIQYVPLYVGSN